MTAKEMFEKLGYKRYEEDNFQNQLEIVDYKKEDRQWREEGGICISFDENKKVSFSFYGYSSQTHLPLYLSEDELQAINKQIEELGWNDENTKQ